MKSMIVEVCCGSVNDVMEAFAAGADRVELNSNLFHGGLTPTIGSLRIARERTENLKIMTMVRPREGGFCYTDAEFAACREDAGLLLDNGSDGLVFGFLNEDGRLDRERTKEIAGIALTKGKEAVFHRAFDVVPDWKETMDQLSELGITRILTSGQKADVSEATQTIREMIRYADGRIQILPGAGLTLENVEAFTAETKTEQIHVAAFRQLRDDSVKNNRDIYFGDPMISDESRFNISDRDCLKKIVRIFR